MEDKRRVSMADLIIKNATKQNVMVATIVLRNDSAEERGSRILNERSAVIRKRNMT
jgi:hypothetical protein